MVKIEESENFHPRRKITSLLKIAAFLEKNLFAKNIVYNLAAGQKAPNTHPPGIGLITTQKH